MVTLEMTTCVIPLAAAFFDFPTGLLFSSNTTIPSIISLKENNKKENKINLLSSYIQIIERLKFVSKTVINLITWPKHATQIMELPPVNHFSQDVNVLLTFAL